MKSLLIGKTIYSILSQTEYGDKVFPLIVNENTQLPFIVYRRVGVKPVDTKDKFICQEIVDVEFVIVSSTYNESVEIASYIADLFTHYKNNDIVDSQIVEVNEEFNEDAFTQIVTIQFKLN